MNFGLDNLKDFSETLNSLADQSNISENSANERNEKLCKQLSLLSGNLRSLADEIHYLGQALLAIKGGDKNESASSERKPVHVHQ